MKTVVALALLCALLAGHGANAVDVGAAINDAANAVANAASSAASSIKDGAGNLVCKSARSRCRSLGAAPAEALTALAASGHDWLG
jgi:4-hydroxyphenylpyruvate dioxygenase-like putative hemolysin